MAEYVHQQAEHMISELEQMLRVGILSNSELKSLVKKRTQYEYKIVRWKKQKRDFLAYIQYEINLLALIHIRRKKISYFFKQDEIEYTIVSRIHRLFKKCIFRWPQDLKLWMSHAAFCVKWKKKVQLGKICTRMLQIHGKQPRLWILAAKWEMECGFSIDKARVFFLQALKLHPKCQKIWQEYFRAELLFADKLYQRMKVLQAESSAEDTTESSSAEHLLMKGETAKIVYKSATRENANNNLNLLINFLEIASLFLTSWPFAQNIVDEICEDLAHNHCMEPKARATIAKLHLKAKAVDDEAHDNSLQQKRRDQECWQEFDRAVADIDTPEMWAEYVNCLMSLVGEKLSGRFGHEAALRDVFTPRLHQLVRVATTGKPPPCCRKPLVQLLLDEGRLCDARRILSRDVIAADLVVLRLKVEMVSDEGEGLTSREFDEYARAANHLSRDEQVEFCSLWMRAAIARDDEGFAAKLATEYCSRHHELAGVVEVQLRFLKWIAAKRGVVEAYKVFSGEMTSCRRVGHFRAMLGLLEGEGESAEELLERAVGEHGADEADLWLDYLRAVRRRGGRDAASRVARVHWRAIKCLKPHLTERFVAGCSLLNVTSS